MSCDDYLTQLQEELLLQQKLQQKKDDRYLTLADRVEIQRFQQKVLNTADDTEVLLLEMQDDQSFDLLRAMEYNTMGWYDNATHIFGGYNKALCGVATGQKVKVDGPILYCDRCITHDVTV